MNRRSQYRLTNMFADVCTDDDDGDEDVDEDRVNMLVFSCDVVNIFNGTNK